MAVVVLDASLVSALLDDHAERHEEASAAVGACRVAGDDVVVPAHAYAEALRPAFREGRGAVIAAQDRLAELGVRVAPVSREAAERAAFLLGRRKTGLRLPDALVLGLADTLGAELVLSARKSWARVHPRIRTV